MTMSPDATVCGQAELLLVSLTAALPMQLALHAGCCGVSLMLRTAPSESRHARHYGRLNSAVASNALVTAAFATALARCQPSPLPPSSLPPTHRHTATGTRTTPTPTRSGARPSARPPARCRPRLPSQLP